LLDVHKVIFDICSIITAAIYASSIYQGMTCSV